MFSRTKVDVPGGGGPWEGWDEPAAPAASALAHPRSDAAGGGRGRSTRSPEIMSFENKSATPPPPRQINRAGGAGGLIPNCWKSSACTGRSRPANFSFSRAKNRREGKSLRSWQRRRWVTLTAREMGARPQCPHRRAAPRRAPLLAPLLRSTLYLFLSRLSGALRGVALPRAASFGSNSPQRRISRARSHPKNPPVLRN